MFIWYFLPEIVSGLQFEQQRYVLQIEYIFTFEELH